MRPYSEETLAPAIGEAADETAVLSGGTEHDSESPSSGGDNAGQSVNVLTAAHAVQSTNVVTPADVQSDNVVTAADGVRGGDAIEHVEPRPIVVPSGSDAHVPENFAASLASGYPGDGRLDRQSPTHAVRGAESAHVSPSNLQDRADEDADVPLREDLRAFRQSLGQRRQNATGPLVIGAVALLAMGVGAYWYKSEVSVSSTPNEVAVDQSVSVRTDGVANGTPATTPDANTNSPPAGTRDRTETLSRAAAESSENDSAKESAEPVANNEAPAAPSTASVPATASPADSVQRSSEPAKASKSRSTRTTRTANGPSAPARMSSKGSSAPSPAVATTRPPNDADAAATERLIARDLGRFAPSPQPSNRTSDRASTDIRDRDAIETQRLVNRDVGAFRNAQRSPPDRAFPEIN